ncbi:unnamed protein product [Clonostachys solani]|uniref:Uncharacterized protein n=1 Tax=Clonostachys solani TaxID=160281 RepID=A0A9P0EME6_9HYPO|nr:unnamed protein product [Clonostachys solani]
MKSWAFCIAMLMAPAALVAAAPLSPIAPRGPCPDAKVDAILKGEMDPSECCSYGKCKGGVVVSVG